jgi:serine/threonine-protein kinase ATR
MTQAALDVWFIFVTTLASDVGPHVGPTSAAIVAGWPSFSERSRETAQSIMNYILLENGDYLGYYLEDIVTLESIPELAEAQLKLARLKEDWNFRKQLFILLHRCNSENNSLSAQSLAELKNFLIKWRQDIQKLASGDSFDSDIGDIVSALLNAACRDGDNCEEVRLQAYDCIGVLGALDPDRFTPPSQEATITVYHNFQDEKENIDFVIHLVVDLLAGAYRAANDITYQNNLAFVLQELLRFCGFTPDLVSTNPRSAVPNPVRKNWAKLPTSVVETVAALLEARLTLSEKTHALSTIPIYPSVTSYREWIQRWTQHLISKVNTPSAETIFSVFRIVVRHQDVMVARHILPHLVLNTIISGEEVDRDDIRKEMLTVLEDQASPNQDSSSERRLLSAQVCYRVNNSL